MNPQELSDKEASARIVLNASEQAAKVVSDAADTAKEVVDRATQVAADLSAKSHEDNAQTTRSLENALRSVFGENEEAKRFVDVSKIPLLCKSVVDINKRVDGINTQLIGIKIQLDFILWILKIVGTAAILAIIAAFFKLILLK